MRTKLGLTFLIKKIKKARTSKSSGPLSNKFCFVINSINNLDFAVPLVQDLCLTHPEV